jgi:prevent-host-death family protein
MIMAMPKQRATETMSVSEARKRFAETLNRVRETDARIVVEKSGIPVAAVVPLSVLRDADERELRRKDALESLRRAQTGFEGVTEEEAEREIAKALDEIKQEQRLARRIVSALVSSDPDLFNSTEEYLVSRVSEYLRNEEAKGRAGRRAEDERE